MPEFGPACLPAHLQVRVGPSRSQRASALSEVLPDAGWHRIQGHREFIQQVSVFTRVQRRTTPTFRNVDSLGLHLYSSKYHLPWQEQGYQFSHRLIKQMKHRFLTLAGLH